MAVMTPVDELRAAAELMRAPKIAEHIASWHPGVASAVADWLEVMARIAAHAAERGYSTNEQTAMALAVARAYLKSGGQ